MLLQRNQATVVEEKYDAHCRVKSMTFITSDCSVPMENPLLGTQDEAGPCVPSTAKTIKTTLTLADLGVYAKETHLIRKCGSIGAGKSARVPITLDVSHPMKRSQGTLTEM